MHIDRKLLLFFFLLLQIINSLYCVNYYDNTMKKNHKYVFNKHWKIFFFLCSEHSVAKLRIDDNYYFISLYLKN